MPGFAWSPAEVDELIEIGWQAYAARNSNRTPDACRVKRNEVLRQRAAEATPAVEAIDKKTGRFDWREANRAIRDMQRLRKDAGWSQDTATIEIPVENDEPILVVALSDTHIGDWGTDYALLERITDEILETPNLYVALLGDLANMAIKLRSVSEVKSDLLPPELQIEYFLAWLDEIAPRVLFATWDNHTVDREEAAAGHSVFARLQSRRFVYHSGIGHPDVKVGDETYRFAVSHRFLGRSIDNPTHAAQRYLRREGHDREIAMQGDYHVPGVSKFMHGPTPKVAIHSGSIQLNSGYAKRWFSLTTAPVFPCVALHPRQHMMTPFWSVAEYKAIAGVD